MAVKRGSDEKGPFYRGAYGRKFHYTINNKQSRERAKSMAANSIINALGEMADRETKKKPNKLTKIAGKFYEDYSKIYDYALLPESERSRRLWKHKGKMGKIRETEAKKQLDVKDKLRKEERHIIDEMKAQHKEIPTKDKRDIKQKTQSRPYRKTENTYDWRTDRVEQKQEKNPKKEAQEQILEEKKKRRTRWLGIVAGSAEPVAKKGVNIAGETYKSGKETYRSLTGQEKRKEFSPIHKLRQKTTMKITNKLRKKGKQVGKKQSKKVLDRAFKEEERYDWRSSRVSSKEPKITQTASYQKGRNIGRRFNRKIKDSFTKTGKSILGKETFNKYVNKAQQRKKRLKKQAAYAKKHPYKAMTWGVGKKTFNVQKKALGKVSNVNKLASKKMANAASLLVKRDGLLAVFKPLYWSLMINAKLMAYPKPFFITFLLFGGLLMIWFFGAMSGYYALFAVKALVAAAINVVLSIGNAFIFAINGLLSLIQLGVVTLINQLFYYFIGGIIEAINTLAGYIPSVNAVDLAFNGLETQVNLQPDVALGYLVPEPINATDVSSGIGSFLFGYAFVSPNAEPFEYDHAAEAYVVEIAYVGDNQETLFFPKVNEQAKTSFLVNMTADKPPPIQYNFSKNVAGYTQQFDPDTGEVEWVLTKQRAVSQTLFQDIIAWLTGKPSSHEEWIKNSGHYYAKTEVTTLRFGIPPWETKIGYGHRFCQQSERDKFFLIAAMNEWDETLITAANDRQPEEWLRTGIITGDDGQTHAFNHYANEARAYAAAELKQAYSIDALIEMESNNYKELCRDHIYPIYINYIEENIAPWYPQE